MCGLPFHGTGNEQNRTVACGVVGRKSGAEPSFNYSPALKSANVTWNAGSLDKFLQGPGNFVHGSRMFLSVPNANDRQNVIAYLGTLKP